MNEEDYKNSLTQMILKYYHYKVPGLVYGQLRNYHDKLGMSYEGMYRTFLYVLEVKGKTFEKNYGLGWIKVFYSEGCNYYHRKQEDKPHTKVTRREIKIKKQAHKPVLKTLDFKEID